MIPLGVELVGALDDPGVHGWAALLAEEGLPYRVVAEPSGTFPVAVVPGGTAATTPPPGGFVVLDGCPSPDVPYVTAPVRWMRSSDGSLVRTHGVAMLPAAPPTDIPDGTPWLVPFVDEHVDRPRQRYPAYVESGRRVLLPMALGRQLGYRGSGFLPYGDQDAAERVELPLPLVDRHGIGRILVDVLRLAFRRCGLPYVHSWYFPEARRSVLLSRFDVDVLDPEAVLDVGRITRAHGRTATFFVNVGGEEETEDECGPGVLTDTVRRHGKVLADLAAAGHEIASHGFRHTLFDDRSACLEDLDASLRVLRDDLGLPVDGYGAPGGVWTPVLHGVLNDLGLRYSSELAVGCDGFPFWPGEGRQGPLQLPISPLIQCQLAVRPDPDSLLETWSRWLARCVDRAEPASFLLHTQDLAALGTDFYEALLTVADRLGLADLTFAELAGWWRRRADTTLSAHYDGNRVEVNVSAPIHVDVDGDVRLVEPAGAAYVASSR